MSSRPRLRPPPNDFPNRLRPAVFHQLHCLDGLRKAYYAALEHRSLHEDAATDRRSDTSPPPLQQQQQRYADHLQPAHMRHFFDLPRQAPTCAADSNLEPVSAMLGVVTGWKSERICRDYGALRRWAEVWKAVPPEPELC